MIQQAVIRVPATSANLGPGYDCLGMALRLYGRARVRRETPERPPGAMAREAADCFFVKARRRPFPFAVEVGGDVPTSRGLGSSVVVRLGVLHGLNALCGEPLAPETLFKLCAALEGHPDNAAPGAFGGFTVADEHGRVQRFAVGTRLKVVLVIPSLEMPTGQARQVLPASVSHAEAARNTANAASIAAAFASRRYEALEGVFADYLHEPFRARLLPGLRETVEAGRCAGALGGYLSGSGSTIACLTLGDPAAVMRAMRRACHDRAAASLITAADNRGVTRLR